MRRIETNNILNWNVAKKTKSIKAKPAISLMVDKSVTSKFLIETLEGKEPLGDGSIICIGEANDIWQQMPKKLLGKYNIVNIDNDGWMVCEPKPENSVNCIEITSKDLPFISKIETLVGDYGLYIVGLWGEQTNEGLIQRADIGDFICQNREEPNDVWIVKRKIFNNTYTIILEKLS